MNVSDTIEKHFKISTRRGDALRKLGIETIRDLLYHFPIRYGHGLSGEGRSLKKGEITSLTGRILSIKMRRIFRKRTMITEAYLNTENERVRSIWFNQPYVAKMYGVGSLVGIKGPVSGKEGSLYFSNPDIHLVKEDILMPSRLAPKNEKTGEDFFVPEYSEARGVSSLWIRHAVKKVLNSVGDSIEDGVPEKILKKYNLPTLYRALSSIHHPTSSAHIEVARKRFSFDEIFFLQILRQKTRHEREQMETHTIRPTKKSINEFLKRFPYTLTKGQKRCVDEIVNDISGVHPMARLLQGDVGSGKTAVAAVIAHEIVLTRPRGQNHGRLQVAYMAPTEILAQQQFNTITSLFKESPVEVGLLTSRGCKKFPSRIDEEQCTDISKRQLLKWIQEGTISMIIGTHAIIQKNVIFKNLSLVIVDEQHRFGIAQRKNVRSVDEKEYTPHLLSMSATPIPRTLALTIYGDLDISVLDESPRGENKCTTKLISKKDYESAYERLAGEAKKGRQGYIICPKINDDEESVTPLHSVEVEEKFLKKKFPSLSISVLHGKMKKEEKEKVMNDFRSGRTDIVVATTVVEVGIDVPNATVMLIQNAERFGLAQLHQLRGRINRSTHHSHCFALTESEVPLTLERLKTFETCHSGFELAEKDHKLRGSGELFGSQQSGLSDFAMTALQNAKLVAIAQKEAKVIIKKDSDLLAHLPIKKELEQRSRNAHFE